MPPCSPPGDISNIFSVHPLAAVTPSPSPKRRGRPPGLKNFQKYSRAPRRAASGRRSPPLPVRSVTPSPPLPETALPPAVPPPPDPQPALPPPPNPPPAILRAPAAVPPPVAQRPTLSPHEAAALSLFEFASSGKKIATIPASVHIVAMSAQRSAFNTAKCRLVGNDKNGENFFSRHKKY